MKLKKINLETFTIALMIIATLSFHDKTKIMVIAQLIAIVYQIIRKKGNISITDSLKKYIIWEFVFIGFGLMSFIWATNTKTILSCVISICQVTMCGITTILYCDTVEKKENITNIIILACAILIARLVVLVPRGAWGNGERIGQYLGSGNSGGYGNTGITYVLSIGAIFILNKAIEKKSKLYYLFFTIVTVFSMLSGSKKAILLFGTTVVLNGILRSKNVVKLLKSLIIVSFIVIMGWYAIMNNSFLYNSVGRRFELLMNYFYGEESDASTLTRSEYIVQAKEIFKKHPILGIGLDGFRYNNTRFCWAENNYMELLADLGLIGTMIYYSFSISIFIKEIKKKIKSKKNNSITIITMFCLLTIVDISMVTYMNDFLQFYLAYIYIIAYDNNKKINESKKMEEFLKDSVKCGY